ncbi:MAG: hypothetical protein K9N34_03730 [Candidatus Marinimicrobia bacterium]|nr:hypothetical protein [Candidatus Neomarinimicrobiota bacterium]MCF7840078.1 hypothetical protein [Candidatus Neomarinimicrobiota bacterium]
MALLGTKPPVMAWRGNVFEFPVPGKGSDQPVYVPLGKVYENVDGERIRGQQSWRFEKEYVFPSLPGELYDVLVAVYNKGDEIAWVPHSDIPFIRYPVHIDSLNLLPVNGIVKVYRVKLKVVSVRPVKKIPSIDNMIGGIWPFRRGVI